MITIPLGMRFFVAFANSIIIAIVKVKTDLTGSIHCTMYILSKKRHMTEPCLNITGFLKGVTVSFNYH